MTDWQSREGVRKGEALRMDQAEAVRDGELSVGRECRMPGCEEPAEEGRYCTVQHEVKYDHLQDDARDAMLADKYPEEAEDD